MRLLLLVLLVACGRPVEKDPGTAGAPFPHPTGYPTHGVEAADPAACAACHAPSGDTEGTHAGPACSTCHAYPHDGTVHQGDVHGPAWLADRAACADCHGADGRRAPLDAFRGTCTGCHLTFPHPAGFAAAHGADVVERGGPQACASCHPAGSGGPGDCASCHGDAYPHPAGFAASTAHGALADATCTDGCHAPDGSGAPTCTSCHDLFPHPEGWTRGHLVPVQARGEASCQGCHRAGTPAGPTLPVSCAASCHGGAE